MEQNKFKKKILPVILLVVLLSVVVGLSYAIWNNSYSTNVNTITSGVVSMSFTESSNVITITNALPMTDDNGKAQSNYFDFSVTSNMSLNSNDPNTDVDYEIILEPMSVDSGYTALTNSQIKVYLENKDTSSILVNPTLISTLTDSESNKILLSTKHTHSYGTNSITTNYRLRAWIDMNVDSSAWTSSTNYEYKFRININGEIDALERPVEYAATTIKNNNTIKTLSSSFWTETIGTDSTKSGLFQFTEEGNTDYFFRGYVNNNWAKFGKETVSGCAYDGHIVSNVTSSECVSQDICIYQGLYLAGLSSDICDSAGGTFITDANLTYFSGEKDIYWRIYRITSSNEIRMIYAGTTAPMEWTQYVVGSDLISSTLGRSTFNTDYDQAEYVGYQYTVGEAHGKSTDSTIKDVIDTWYDDNLKSNYENYISTSNYCYDRNTITGTYGSRSFSGTDGYGTTPTWFAGVGRLLASEEDTIYKAGGTGPSLVCSNANDNYSLKIGLLSADEAALAGLKIFESDNNDTNNYLITNEWYWTGSPFAQFSDASTLFYVSHYGALDYGGNSYTTRDVRPVVSLNSNIAVASGTGSWNNPYVFETND